MYPDHLVILDTAVRQAFKEKRHLVAVFFDIEKAFDTTWHHGILRKLHSFGVRGHMGWFLSNFLKDRFFKVRLIDVYSDRFYQRNGVPQGGVLSVPLFAVMVNDIADTLPAGVSHSLFVDDFAVWFSTSSTASAERRIQLCIDKLTRWGSTNGFTFSSTKTACMHFCNRKRYCVNPQLQMYGNPIPVAECIRFLGMLLDKRLTYVEHFKSLRLKCFKAMTVLKVVSRMAYGSDRKTMLLLYRSLIRSKLDYASIVYDSALESSKRMLDTVHHQGVRVATGAFRTSPVSSLLVDANEPPLRFRRQLLTMRYALRVRQLPSHPTFQSVFSSSTLETFDSGVTRGAKPICVRVANLMEDADIDVASVTPLIPNRAQSWLLEPPSCDTELTRFSKPHTHAEELRQEAQKHIVTNYTDCIHYYTDESKASLGTGCALCICVRRW